MTQFTVRGPFAVPVHRARAGRVVRAAEGREFFEHHEGYAESVGCYVFAMKTGRGTAPVYVGRATKGFARECFRPHKLGKYNECLADYRRGRPVMFLVVLPRKPGANNIRHIKELESYLIRTAADANPDLLNVQGKKKPRWGIRGVVRSKPGKRSAAATAFRTMLRT